VRRICLDPESRLYQDWIFIVPPRIVHLLTADWPSTTVESAVIHPLCYLWEDICEAEKLDTVRTMNPHWLRCFSIAVRMWTTWRPKGVPSAEAGLFTRSALPHIHSEVEIAEWVLYPQQVSVSPTRSSLCFTIATPKISHVGSAFLMTMSALQASCTSKPSRIYPVLICTEVSLRSLMTGNLQGKPTLDASLSHTTSSKRSPLFLSRRLCADRQSLRRFQCGAVSPGVSVDADPDADADIETKTAGHGIVNTPAQRH
jgi:hypothetical protein